MTKDTDLIIADGQQDSNRQTTGERDTMRVHFVGFRSEEYWSAVRVFGPPDFVHLWHDRRMYGDVAEGDCLVFGPRADPSHISRYSWQDHEVC